VGLPYHNPYHTSYREYAAFTDVTYRFTDRFDVQVGGRISRNEQDLSALFEGVFMPAFFGVPSGYVYPKLNTDDTSFTYLVTPRFEISSDLMLYARFASGYRPGGPQPNATAVGSPPFFDSDTTRNYEVGVKGDVFDHVVGFEASVFYIDWKGIQLQLRDPVTTFAYFGNGGGAKSQGLELSGQVRPWQGMTIASWVAWNDAELTQAFPPGPAAGHSGDRLPFSSRFSGNIGFDQEFSLIGRAMGELGASISYVGNRLGGFTANGIRQVFPAYTQTDVRAGARLDSWSVDLFVNNLTDRRAILAGGLGTAQTFAFAYIQPRTYGLSVAKSF
jgi:outer membrane receptor protein involved in Fe transport